MKPFLRMRWKSSSQADGILVSFAGLAVFVGFAGFAGRAGLAVHAGSVVRADLAAMFSLVPETPVFLAAFHAAVSQSILGFDLRISNAFDAGQKGQSGLFQLTAKTTANLHPRRCNFAIVVVLVVIVVVVALKNVVIVIIFVSSIVVFVIVVVVIGVVLVVVILGQFRLKQPTNKKDENFFETWAS